MTPDRFAHDHLSDDELLREVARLARAELGATARLVAALAEVDSRRLYLAQSCSSLFVYCTRVLRLSEHAAYGRIEAARASRRFPVLLEMLERGDLTLTSLCLLAPHLTVANHADVLARARHLSKREVEEVVASLHPRADVPTLLRRIPERPVRGVNDSPATSPVDIPCSPTVTASRAKTPEPTARPTIQPLSPQRYRLQVTLEAATREKLQRVQDLLRHQIPSGDLAMILDRALDLLLADLERTKMASAARPRVGRRANAKSRHIPAAVRRMVWRRDGGRCAFTGHWADVGRQAFWNSITSRRSPPAARLRGEH